jgi:hypothetical protein
MNSGDRWGQKNSGGFWFLRSPYIGTPSAWLFLIRLHACRAGLRFARQTSIPAGQGNAKEIRVQRRSRRVEDWSGRPDVLPGVRKRHRRRDGSTRYQASTDRQWANTDSGASVRRPTRIEGSRRPSPGRAGVPQAKPPVCNATTGPCSQGGFGQAARSQSNGREGRIDSPAATVRSAPTRGDGKKRGEKTGSDLTPTAS